MTIKFYVTCADGRVITAIKYLAVEPSNNRFIIINSALGVRQSFYQHLAKYLTENGYIPKPLEGARFQQDEKRAKY
jgi:predicted alpha/beta hydrolase